MDLDLDGLDVNEHKIITCNIEGIIDEDDLRELALGEPSTMDADGKDNEDRPIEPTAEVDDPSDLRKIREKHHSVARLLAQGMRQGLVARIVGYSDSYLSVLLNNPAMDELIDMYRVQNGSAAEVIGENLRRVGGKALEKLEAKIDKGEVDTNGLIQASKLGFDRSGHGPSSTQRNINENHDIDHAAIAELNLRARQGSKSFTIPMEEVRRALPNPDSEAAA